MPKEFTFGYCKRGQTPSGCGAKSARQLVALYFRTGRVSARICRQCCKRHGLEWPAKVKKGSPTPS